jgi:C4-dicarboxylate-specific signal transduction histidine kinase
MNISNTTQMFLIIVLALVSVFSILSAFGLRARLRRSELAHREQLRKTSEEQSEKLFSHSKYSELGMMSAGIAHEINNPLAVIQARATQLLRIYRQTDRLQDVADGLQQILYTSERINRTVQGIREFVHHDDRLPNTEVDLKLLVDDVLAFCGQRMKNHGVNLRFYNMENHYVLGNKIQLEQILLNLLNNAFDAIEYLSDKWIEISCEESDDKVQIIVKDSGTGIPPEVAERIMEPFFSTKDIGKGTGLGLALARGIAEKHGGKLSYLSGSAHTTFVLELPRPLSRDRQWEKVQRSTTAVERNTFH